MLRGRKRRFPFCYVPEPYLHGSDLEHDSHDDEQNELQHRLVPRQQQQHLAQRNERDPDQVVHRQPQEQHDPQGINIVDPNPQAHPHLGQRQAIGPVRGVVRAQNPVLRPNLLPGYHNLHQPRQQRSPQRRQNVQQQQPFPREQGILPNRQYEEPEQEQEEEEEDEDENEEDEEQESDSDNDLINVDHEEEHDYDNILEKLSEKWLLAEIDHCTSKTASNSFWRIAAEFFPKLQHAREIQNVTRKIPQFKHIRTKLYDKEVPDVNLEIGYRDKETGEIIIVQSQVTPKSRFPPHQYEKLYETASVKVLFFSFKVIYFSYVMNSV